MRGVVVALIALVALGGALALTVGPLTFSELQSALRDARFHNEAGYAFGQAGDWNSALREFRVATQLDPTSESAQRNLAIALFQTGAYEEAILQYRELREQSPGDRTYQFDLAQSLVAHARYQATDAQLAVDELHEAIELLDGVGDYPHARENAQIIRNVLAEVGA